MTNDVPTPRGLGEILVPIDLTPLSDRILARVALLPLARRARLTLLHVVSGDLPVPAQRRAKRDARKALAAEARHLSQSVPATVRIDPIVSVGTAASEIATYGVNAELVVMGRGGGRGVRDAFLGSTAERVLRRTQRPVLVVRLPARTAYRRPALALDLDEAAAAALEQLLRVIPAPRPPVTVVHAYDLPYHGRVYPSLSELDAEEDRDHYRLEAVREVGKLLATSLVHANVEPKAAPIWKTHVGYGSPRAVIAKAIKKADTDLLVLGTHAHAGIAYVILGTVAGDVLRAVSCDVLVVPPQAAA